MLTTIGRSKWTKSASDTDVSRMSMDCESPVRGFFGGFGRCKSETIAERGVCECQQPAELVDLRRHRKERKTKCLTMGMKRNVEGPPGREFFLQRFPYWTDKQDVELAGRRIVGLMMLNAWRRRREDTDEARVTVNFLTDQVDSLNMQVYVLRQLLDNEKARATVTARAIKINLSKIEEFEEERKVLIEEKEKSESELMILHDLVCDLKNKCAKQEKDLTAANSEIEMQENRFQKERKRLKILKDQNVTLLKEAEIRETQITQQSQCMEELRQCKKKLQEKLDAEIPLLEKMKERILSVEEQLEWYKISDKQQQLAIAKKEEEIRQLQAELLALEEKLREKDEKNGELGKLVSDKSKEMVLLNEKLLELTKSQKLWSNRVVRVASLCTRIPIACFYTLATLLLPQPSYRPL